MKTARMIGNYVEHKAHETGMTIDELSELLDFSNQQTESFLKGRTLLTFNQMSTLANHFHVTVPQMIEGDKESYSSSVVHCMNEFDHEDNREKILDIIDDYMDIVDALDQL